MSVAGKKAKLDSFSFADDQITVRIDTDPRTVQTRKKDLVASSKYFEAMFQSSFEESTSDTITLSGDVISFKVLEMLVVFMESKTLNPTFDIIEELFVAADYLQMPTALRVLTDYIYATLAARKLDDIRKPTIHMLLRLLDIMSRFASTNGYTYQTRTVIYINSQTFRSQAVKCSNEVILYIAYHFKTIMYDLALLKLEFDMFEKILRSDFLRMSEVEVVRIIKIWTNFDFEARRKHYGALIKCVRFDDGMTVDFIMEEVLDYIDCSAAKDYVISIFAKKLGYTKDISDIGPTNSKVRIHRRWDPKQDKCSHVVGVKDEGNATL